jgi:hypothetical protein
MELADGSLEDSIATICQDCTEAFAIFDGVCSGTAHLHEHSLLHRDIKPANILLIGRVPKLCDLGLCLFDGADRLTATDEAVGPRIFMAPELEGGHNPDVDARADVYSLGKVFYYLLTGGRVFPRERLFVGRHSLEQAYRDARLRGFDRMLNHCITESPLDRYKDAGELLAAFRALCGAFRNHPLTTLFEKDAECQTPAAINGPQFLEALTGEELCELLKLYVDSGKVPPEECLAWFAARPAEPYARELLKVVCAARDSIPEPTFSALAIRLFRQQEVWDAMSVAFRDAFEKLAQHAASSGDVEALRMMAPRLGLERMPGVVEQIHHHFDLLPAEEQKAFLALTIRCGFEGKSQWFLERLPTFHDEIAIEAAFSGIFSFGSPDTIAASLALGKDMKTDAEIAALGRALVNCASPEVVDGIKQNSEFDQKLRVLARMRQSVDNGDEGLDAVRDEFLQGQFDA